MKNDKYDSENNTFIDVLLVIGIIILGSNNMDGWGWLVLILLIRNC